MKKTTAAIILAIAAVLLIGLTYTAFVGFPIGIYDVNPLQNVVQKGAETGDAYAVIYKASGDITDEQLTEATAIINARLSSAGYDVASASEYGTDSVLVSFPQTSDASYFLQYLGNVGEITFTNSDDEVIVTDAQIAKAEYLLSSGTPYVYFTFNAEGTTAFATATKAAATASKNISIKLDGTTLTSNSVDEAITTGTCGISLYGADIVAAIKNVGSKLPVSFTIDTSFATPAAAGANGATVLAYGGIALVAIALLFFILRYKSFSPAPIASLWLMGLGLLVVLALNAAGLDLTIATASSVITGLVLFVITQSLVLENVLDQQKIGKPVRAAFQGGVKEGMKMARYINYALFLAAMAVFAFGTAGFRQYSVMLMIAIVWNMLLTATVTRGIGNCVLAFRNNAKKA